MQRKGFSLIELIFVIVIIGILAVLAVPRLSATRDDATISVAGQNINTAIKDIGAFFVARGAFDNNASVMSNFMTAANDWVGDINNTATWNNCITLDTDVNGTLTVGHVGTPNALCTQVQALVPAAVHQFGGTGIIR